jgi:hypothetical protein
MKSLSTAVSTQAIVMIILGIFFTIYAPNMLAYFGIPNIPENNTLLYWNIAAFARLFGAALFGFGLLLWAVRSLVTSSLVSVEIRRGIFFALALAGIVGIIVALTQQFGVWSSAAGWVMILLFLALTMINIAGLVITSREA